jgi:hypothetical protein
VRIGYARASTVRKSLDTRRDSLKAAGVPKISTRATGRPELDKAIVLARDPRPHPGGTGNIPALGTCFTAVAGDWTRQTDPAPEREMTQTFRSGDTITIRVIPSEPVAVFIMSDGKVRWTCQLPGGTLDLAPGYTEIVNGMRWERIVVAKANTVADYELTCSSGNEQNVVFGVI